MAPKIEISADGLRETLDYDPTTGVFRWKRGRRGVAAGSIAGTTDSNGYRYIGINQVWYLAHRLAWLYVNGEWPKSRLGFCDGSPQNCAIDNIYELGYEHGTRHKPLLTAEEKQERAKTRYRRSDLERRFGVTEAQYQVMHDGQDGKCAICGEAETATRNGNVRWLAVDHDHADGRIRELLCAACNVGLGNFGDDPARLRAAAAYLERHAAMAAEEAA